MKAFAYIQKQDVRLFFFFHRHMQCLIMDIIMVLITQMGSLLFACLVPAALFLTGRRELAELAVRMAIILIVSQLLVQLVKRLVNRPRPYKKFEDVLAKHPPNCKYSFPSGHTSTAFALAIALASTIPGTGIAAYSIASMVGLSRVYLGVHYPTDVVVGSVTAYAAYLLTCI